MPAHRHILLCFVLAASGVGSVAAQVLQPTLEPPDAPAKATSGSSVERSSESTIVPLESNEIETKIFDDPLPAPATAAPAAPMFLFADKPLVLNPTFRLRGRVEVDSTFAVQSEESQNTIGDLQNGFGFRRVRLGAQGNIEDSTSWISEVELAGGNVRLRDVFVALDALPGVRQVRIGHFREPYNLEGMTSSNFMTFLERSAPNVISPVRNWGVCAYWWPDDERLLYSFGVFRDGTTNSGQSLGDDDNWAYTTRLTGLPIYEPNEAEFRLVHLGAAFSQRVPPNGTVNFSRRIGSNILSVDDNPGSPFLPTLDIPADNYQLYNLQAACIRGSLSLQAEWSAAVVQQTNAGLIYVHGMYFMGSYFLTGEHRGYNRTRGSFDQVEVLHPVTRKRDPRAGFGAVELAARFAYLDFDSANLPLDVNGAPAGTRLYEMTFGVNWYLNSYTRIMADYTAGMPDKVGFNPTLANIYGVRTAIYW